MQQLHVRRTTATTIRAIRVIQDKRTGATLLTSISHLRLARSSDGVHFTVEAQPGCKGNRRTKRSASKIPHQSDRGAVLRQLRRSADGDCDRAGVDRRPGSHDGTG